MFWISGKLSGWGPVFHQFDFRNGEAIVLGLIENVDSMEDKWNGDHPTSVWFILMKSEMITQVGSAFSKELYRDTGEMVILGKKFPFGKLYD